MSTCSPRGTAPESGWGPEGKRLHKLDSDPEPATVVWRIFAEFIAWHGFYVVAKA